MAVALFTCLRCGYDLRAHPDDGVCPECGLRIVSSRAGLLRSNAASWFLTVRVGILLLLISGTLMSFEPRIRYGLGDRLGSYNAPFRQSEWAWALSGLAYLVPLILLAVGSWLFATPTRIREADPLVGRAARLIRPFSVIALLAAIAALGVRPYPAMFGWTAESFPRTLGALLLFTNLSYGVRLMRRLPAWWRARFVGLATFPGAVLVAILIARSAVFVALPPPSPPPRPFALAQGWTISGATRTASMFVIIERDGALRYIRGGAESVPAEVPIWSPKYHPITAQIRQFDHWVSVGSIFWGLLAGVALIVIERSLWREQHHAAATSAIGTTPAA